MASPIFQAQSLHVVSAVLGEACPQIRRSIAALSSLEDPISLAEAPSRCGHPNTTQQSSTTCPIPISFCPCASACNMFFTPYRRIRATVFGLQPCCSIFTARCKSALLPAMRSAALRLVHPARSSCSSRHLWTRSVSLSTCPDVTCLAAAIASPFPTVAVSPKLVPVRAPSWRPNAPESLFSRRGYAAVFAL